MKITCKTGGRGYDVNHNDRNFDMDKASHINQELTKKNLYIFTDQDTRNITVCRGNENKTKTLQEHEMEYYRKHYQERLDSINAKYKASRHEERCKTMEDMYKDKKTCPEESILQIGRQEETRNIKPETYERILSEYIKWQNKTFPQCKILDAAIHYDERSPHIHLRQVWEYTNDRGELQVGQGKALEQMGIERPNPEKQTNRYNNAKITFSTMCRESWRNICIEHGLNIDEIEHTGKISRDHDEIRADALKTEIERSERKLEVLHAQELSVDERAKLRAYEQVFGQPEEWGICEEFKEFMNVKTEMQKSQHEYLREYDHDIDYNR